MVCSWRRTLASVFLLLSSHNVRVLSQNVVPTGPLPPLSFLREPLRERIGLNSGSGPQQQNLCSNPPNGVQQEFVPLGPSGSEYHRTPEYFGPLYAQAVPINSVSQSNIGPIPQDTGFNIPEINSLPTLQGPVYNTLPSTNFNGPPLLGLPNSILSPLPLSQSFNIPPKPNIAPFQGPSSYIPPNPFTSIPQGQTISNPPVFNLPLPQGLKPPLTSQNPILPGLEVPITPITRPAWNLLPNVQNQNTQTFPLGSTSYPQPVAPPACTQYPLTPDLTSMRYLPTPNLPPSIPTQNYAPTLQSPIQPAMYPKSSVSVDYLPNTNFSPNYQISALPPVFPTNKPRLHDSCIGNFQTIPEEYSPVPINLQINVPPPTTPEPKITIITAYPSTPALPAPATTIDSTEVSFGMYPSPPIIIEGRRCNSRSWLPLFLIALFARDGYFGGGGACCPCNVASADIPIPYPIPIPTNNPIIIKNSCRSSKKMTKAKTSDKKKN